MKRRSILILGIIFFNVSIMAACANKPTPTPAPTSTSVPTATLAPSATPTQLASSNLETKSNSAGSVAVDVKPTMLAVGQPISFDIAMNTHSVSLIDDMVQASLLRDDSGKEYKPSTWKGDGVGGHHRSGTLVFGALTAKPKFIELVIKGVAKVPERVFHWDLSE